jgi:outer membrane biosynthesis protein TonB
MPRLLIVILSVLAISASAQAPQSAPNFKGRPLLKVSTKVLEKTAVKKVKPVAPAGVTASGIVSVRVWVDPLDGKLVDAKVVSGHPSLHKSALKAARQWEWEYIDCINGLAPIVVGILNFDFPPK